MSLDRLIVLIMRGGNNMQSNHWGGLLVALIGLVILIFMIITMSGVGCFAWMFAGRGVG